MRSHCSGSFDLLLIVSLMEMYSKWKKAFTTKAQFQKNIFSFTLSTSKEVHLVDHFDESKLETKSLEKIISTAKAHIPKLTLAISTLGFV